MCSGASALARAGAHGGSGRSRPVDGAGESRDVRPGQGRGPTRGGETWESPLSERGVLHARERRRCGGSVLRTLRARTGGGTCEAVAVKRKRLSSRTSAPMERIVGWSTSYRCTPYACRRGQGRDVRQRGRDPLRHVDGAGLRAPLDQVRGDHQPEDLPVPRDQCVAGAMQGVQEAARLGVTSGGAAGLVQQAGDAPREHVRGRHVAHRARGAGIERQRIARVRLPPVEAAGADHEDVEPQVLVGPGDRLRDRPDDLRVLAGAVQDGRVGDEHDALARQGPRAAARAEEGGGEPGGGAGGGVHGPVSGSGVIAGECARSRSPSRFRRRRHPPRPAVPHASGWRRPGSAAAPPGLTAGGGRRKRRPFRTAREGRGAGLVARRRGGASGRSSPDCPRRRRAYPRGRVPPLRSPARPRGGRGGRGVAGGAAATGPGSRTCALARGSRSPGRGPLRAASASRRASRLPRSMSGSGPCSSWWRRSHSMCAADLAGSSPRWTRSTTPSRRSS